jgi:hypothetical protein
VLGGGGTGRAVVVVAGTAVDGLLSVCGSAVAASSPGISRRGRFSAVVFQGIVVVVVVTGSVFVVTYSAVVVVGSPVVAMVIVVAGIVVVAIGAIGSVASSVVAILTVLLRRQRRSRIGGSWLRGYCRLQSWRGRFECSRSNRTAAWIEAGEFWHGPGDPTRNPTSQTYRNWKTRSL